MRKLNPPPSRIPIRLFSTSEVKDYFNRQKEALRLVYNVLSSPMTSVLAYSLKTADYTLVDTDYLIHYASGSFTATLMDATKVPPGSEFEIKNSGAGTITAACFGAQTIDGTSTKSLAQHEKIRVMSDGANWITV